MHAVGARTGPPLTVDYIRCRWEIAERCVSSRWNPSRFRGWRRPRLAGHRRGVARVWFNLTVLPPRFRLEWTRHHHHTVTWHDLLTKAPPGGSQVDVHNRRKAHHI